MQSIINDQNIWDNVDKGQDHECWNWRGTIYYKNLIAIYESFSGHEVTPDLSIAHICNNIKCCNPLHITLEIKMSENGLSLDNILTIRNAMDKIDKELLAKLYNVSIETISSIWTKRIHKCKEGLYIRFYLEHSRNCFSGNRMISKPNYQVFRI